MNDLTLRENLVVNVRQFPGNLTQAFILTAKQQKSTFSIVKRLYYTDVRVTTPLFIMKTNEGFFINLKSNPRVNKDKRFKMPILKHNPIDLKDLTAQEKADLFDIILG